MSRIGSVIEAVRGNGGQMTTEQMRNQLKAANATTDAVQENLLRLEMAMEDDGWRRLGWDADREFTRQGISEIIKVSRALYISHPLIQRAVDVKTYYVWAQGVSRTASDGKVQELIVDPFINDMGNQAELFGHQSQLLTDVDQQVDGSLFYALHTSPLGDVSVRTIPVEQFTEIMTREGDAGITTFYRRVWAEDIFDAATGERRVTQKEELYPDFRYHPDMKPETVGGLRVNWETPIMYNKTGGLKHMKFGIPETFSSMEWARAYKGFLEDWHTLVKSLSRFAWKATTHPKKIKGLKRRLEEEGKGSEGEEAEGEEPAKGSRRKRIGDAFIGKEGDKLESINKTGATVSSDDARPSRLMVAAAFGLPDTILSGDVDIGNFATSKTLDRPTELMMVSRQTFYSQRERDLIRYQMDAKVRSLDIPGKRVKDPRTGLNMIVPTMDPTVEISFPPVLEHDVKGNVDSIIAAATLNGKADAGVIPPELRTKMLLEALGVDDVEKAMDEMPDETAEVVEAMKGLEEAIRGSVA